MIMLVQMQSNVLGYRSGDVVELPADHPGLDGALEGGYARKLTKAQAAKLGVEPLTAAESAADDDDAEHTTDP